MADVLSQREIDALLNAYKSGELDIAKENGDKKSKVVKLYDFKRPNKISKEQLRTISLLHENFARSLSTFLSGYLRTLVEIEVRSVDQTTYYEFSSSFSNSALFTVINFEPLKGSMVMEIYNSMVFSFVDRILGGIGETSDIERNFSEIELVLMQKLITRMLSILKDTWSNVVDVNPKLEKLETNSQFIQIVSPSEIVVVVSIAIKVGKNEGFMNFCLPYVVIEPILPKLTTKSWYGTSENVSSKDTDKIERKIDKSLIDIKAILGKTHLSIKEFLDIKIGDIIRLDNSINDDLIVMVDGKEKFKGKPGKKNNKIAVKLTEILKVGDDNE